MALSHQIGRAALKSASEMAAELAGNETAPEAVSEKPKKGKSAPDKLTGGSLEFYEAGNLEAPALKVDLTGERKVWGVRIDKAVLDLVKRNSKNQTQDAEDMVLLYAAKKGWS